MPLSTQSPLSSIFNKYYHVNMSNNKSSHISQPPSPVLKGSTSVVAANCPLSAMSTIQSADIETFLLSTANSAMEGSMCQEVQFQRMLVEHEHSDKSLKYLNTFSKVCTTITFVSSYLNNICSTALQFVT